MGQGQSGPQGLKGPIGPIGPLGPEGKQGSIGLQGIQGIEGPIGKTGPIGIQGPIGPEGKKGDQGIPGLVGPQGLQGLQGLQGFQGIPGVSNIPGPIGSIGQTGPQGIIGPIGPQGPIGEVSKDFMKGNSLWCADGELCKIPNTKKGIDFGYGGSKISDLGNLTLETDDNIDFKTGSGNGLTAALTNDHMYLYGSRGVQFGHGFDRDANAGQISYGRHDGGADGSLNIVGGGKNGQSRVVRVWDTLRIGDGMLRQDDDWIRSIGNQNDTQSYDAGKGLAAKNLWAKNKIFAGGRDILAELDDLRNNAVRKDKQYFIRSNRGGMLIDGGGWSSNKGDWETMKFEQK